MDSSIKSLSKQWRINRSSIQSLEYVEILRSLKRLADYHTDKIERIRYTSENDKNVAYHQTGSISINPRVIKEVNTYPLPDESFDVLCGLTLHETAHELVGSVEVMAQLIRGTLRPAAEMGEELVVDHYFGKGSKQESYIRTARRYFDVDRGESCNTDSALRDAINAYTSMILYNHPVQDVSDRGREILLVMLKGFANLSTLEPGARRGVYHTVSLEIRNILGQDAAKQRVSDPRGKRLRASRTIQDYADKVVEEQVGKAEEVLEKELGEEGTGLTVEEQAEIQDLLDEEASDVSDLITSLVNELGIENRKHAVARGRGLCPVVTKNCPKDYNGYWTPNPELVNSLMWLRNVKMFRDTVVERGLEAGRIDKRRLYRAGIDGLIFRENRQKKQMKRRIWLLMDNSGSMDGRSGAPLFEMCAAVHRVLPEARVYTYHEEDAQTQIMRVDDNRGMKRMTAGSLTPSGDAIIFISHLLQKEGGGVLLHFTDGGSNWGTPIEDAFRVVMQKMTKVALIDATPYEMSRCPDETGRIVGVETHDSTTFGRLLRETVARMWRLV